MDGRMDRRRRGQEGEETHFRSVPNSFCAAPQKEKRKKEKSRAKFRNNQNAATGEVRKVKDISAHLECTLGTERLFASPNTRAAAAEGRRGTEANSLASLRHHPFGGKGDRDSTDGVSLNPRCKVFLCTRVPCKTTSFPTTDCSSPESILSRTQAPAHFSQDDWKGGAELQNDCARERVGKERECLCEALPSPIIKKCTIGIGLFCFFPFGVRVLELLTLGFGPCCHVGRQSRREKKKKKSGTSEQGFSGHFRKECEKKVNSEPERHFFFPPALEQKKQCFPNNRICYAYSRR